MKFTHYKFRLAMGILIVAAGLVLGLYPPGFWLPKFMDSVAWLFIGAVLCFTSEFNLRFNRDWLWLGLGLILAGMGFYLTVSAILSLPPPRAHGLLPFYDLIGVGPMMLAAGIIIGFDRRRTDNPQPK